MTRNTRSTTATVLALLLALAATSARAQEAGPAADALHGEIDAVTVYRGQALVTRLVNVPGDAGLRELVIGDLPEHVVPGSLYAETDAGMEVRSVRFRSRAVREDVREAVRELDEQIQGVQRTLTRNQRFQSLLEQRRGYLDRLEQFTADTANRELTQGVLDAETLTTLSDYLLQQRTALAERALELEVEAERLNEQLNLLRRQRSELAGGSSRTAREAVVFVNVEQPGELRLHYLVNHASWSPSYNVRAGGEDAADEVQLEYLASVRQMSGEDWPNVRMTLSTATPNLVARAPELTPLKVALTPQQQAGERGSKDSYARLRTEQRNLEQERAQQGQQLFAGDADEADAPSRPGTFAPTETNVRRLDHAMNTVASNVQIHELLEAEPARRDADRVARPEETVSVTYQLAGRTALPSRDDRQLIQIAAVDLPASVYRVATPVLTEHVFREAELANTSGRVLLAGPVGAYRNGQFVGHGSLPTVAPGERFTVGLGVDPSLRAGRELVDRDESTQGGNRVVEISYRLSLTNFSNEPAEVRLLDRLPVADNETAVRVTLVEPGEPLSDAPAAVRQRDQGLLRWDLTVPGDAADDARELTYRYRIEYDRQQTITGLPGE
ncbi:MAG: mucoidy inhibitor MuiA family protein [Phycisphaeraceae bacterium]